MSANRVLVRLNELQEDLNFLRRLIEDDVKNGFYVPQIAVSTSTPSPDFGQVVTTPVRKMQYPTLEQVESASTEQLIAWKNGLPAPGFSFMEAFGGAADLDFTNSEDLAAYNQKLAEATKQDTIIANAIDQRLKPVAQA